MTGLTYPYTKYDRILGDNLADDLELNPKTTPPSGTAGGAGRYKFWADTTNPLGASLRQATAERATAGFYVATEWLTWGTIDLAARKFHFNTDGVDFSEGTGPLVVHALTVTGATSLNTLTVSGATTFGVLNAGATTLASLTVSGNTLLHATNVVGDLSATGIIAGGSLYTTGAITGGSLHVTGNTDLDGTLNAGATTLASLTVSGDTLLHATNVVGDLSVTGTVAGGSFYTTGAITGGSLHITGNTDLDGTLNVDGATTMSSLHVTGALTTGSGGLTVGTMNATKYQLSGVDFATRDGTYHMVHRHDGTVGVQLGDTTSIFTNDVTTWNHRSGWGVFPPGSGLMSLDYTGLHVSALVVAETFSIRDAGTDYAFASVGVDLVAGATATIIVGPEYASTNSSRIGLYSTGQTYNKAAEHNFWSLTSGATFAVFNAGGTANVSGSWNIICDDAVKENVTPYSPGLTELLQLNPVSYNYVIPPASDPALLWSPFAKLREGETEPPTHYGLMASNVMAVIPEMVTEMTFSDIPQGIPNTPLATIAPTHLVWVLINAAKTLASQDDALEVRIAAVEADLGDNPPYAPITSPNFLGVPTAITPARTVATTQLATTAFVRLGTDTNDSAPAGQIGEYQMAQVLSTAAITLTTATDAGVVSLSLTPGDWEVTGSLGVNMTNPSNCSVRAWVNLTGAATAPSIDQVGGNNVLPVQNGATLVIMPITQMRVSLATATSIRLGATATFTGGPLAAWGKLTARRVR